MMSLCGGGNHHAVSSVQHLPVFPSSHEPISKAIGAPPPASYPLGGIRNHRCAGTSIFTAYYS
jgi:hypothetical protein